MSSLSVFQFESNNVRVLMVDNEPWFVAKDICEILEVRNVSDALDRLDSDEKNTIVLSDGNRGNPNTAIISESGMYALVLSSRKPEAKPFRKWVTSEVLPSLRKIGTYSLPSAPTATKPGCLLAYEERVLQLPQKLKVPEGYWTVLEESAYLLLHIEQVLKVPVNRSDLLDGSIGKMWSAHLVKCGRHIEKIKSGRAPSSFVSINTRMVGGAILMLMSGVNWDISGGL